MTRPGPWSRPPFERDNVAALHHGARSARTVQPIADEIAAQLAEIAPWASLPAFGAAVAAWSYTEAQAVLLRRWIDEHGVFDSDGVPVPAMSSLDRTEARAARLRGELGLTPLAWSRLLATLGSADPARSAAALDALKATGRELAEATREIGQ